MQRAPPSFFFGGGAHPKKKRAHQAAGFSPKALVAPLVAPELLRADGAQLVQLHEVVDGHEDQHRQRPRHPTPGFGVFWILPNPES